MKQRMLQTTLMIIVVLCAGCILCVERQQQQYDRNRQLIDALLRNDTQTAFALVNAGADPNTHAFASPAPTFKSIVNQFLHHTPSPVNTSPTAFQSACGYAIKECEDDPGMGTTPKEDRLLIHTMLARGADVKALLSNQSMALGIAITEYRPCTVEMLLNNGADPNAMLSGYKPLVLAALCAKFDIVELLLAHGANPKTQDGGGSTALHCAVCYGADIRCISELLAAGADPNMRDETGQTVLNYAETSKRPDLVRLLKQYGAKKGKIIPVKETKPAPGEYTTQCYQSDVSYRVTDQ